jgi:hypothetical protein
MCQCYCFQTGSVQILEGYSIDTQIECPSPSCTCNGISATCSDNQLSYIPRFPGKIRKVYMLNTNLGNISDEGLSNLTFNYICYCLRLNMHYTICLFYNECFDFYQ